MGANATIYIADPSLLGAKFFTKFREIKNYQGIQKGDQATGIKIDLDGAQIVMNFMPLEQIPDHLNGFEGYVHAVGCANEDKLLYTIGRLRQVCFVIGCVISPGFDKNNNVHQFLYNFTNRLNGLLFVHNRVIDYDGEVLVEPVGNR